MNRIDADRGIGAKSLALRCAGVGLLLLALPACSSIGKALGVEKSVPDEFAVVTKAPLTLPPDYNLRPPQPGAPRPQELVPTRAAAQALFPAGTQHSQKTNAEVALLEKAGANDAPENIRQIVNSETTGLEEKEQTFANQILFWQDTGHKPELVDAEAEAQRIQEAQATGEPVTEGETPMVTEESDGGLLNGILF
jgi:hypothetical protein